MLWRARERHRNVAKVYDKVEEEVTEALGELEMCVYGGNTLVELRHRKSKRK